MAKRNGQSRVLIYSHDTFGLGHLRRCRAIAHDLVGRHQDMSVLILSGSPILGSFDFRSRVDFIRIPGVIKLRDGDYTPLNLHIDIEETLALRASIIEHTAEIFDPDLFLVDKEPLGLRGEVRKTLEMMKKRGTPSVLGLRDVMDDPQLLGPEWERKNAMPALSEFYEQIWVYGLPSIHDPLEGLAVPEDVSSKITYTGYLKRTAGQQPRGFERPFERPYLLVTPGGGGDGEELVDWVLSAYESGTSIGFPALIVLGPFMQRERQVAFQDRASALADVEITTFESHLEPLMVEAAGVVAMGGYNTFCEILSFDKRAVLVPRTRPRREQLIRAERASALGLVKMLENDSVRDPLTMAAALQQLPYQPKPSEKVVPGLLEGLDSVNRMVERQISRVEAMPAPERPAASNTGKRLRSHG